jgi:hypothetical protein
MSEADELERAVTLGCLAAVRRRAHCRRQMAKEQSGPRAVVSTRLAIELEHVAGEIEAEARR